MIQEVAAVIDRSGSMSGKEADTIGGINTTIEELKKNKTSTEIIKFSVKFFDHEEYLKFRNLDIEKSLEYAKGKGYCIPAPPPKVTPTPGPSPPPFGEYLLWAIASFMWRI